MLEIITTIERFQEIVASGNSVVIYFTAVWCGPCRMISPIFEAESKKEDFKDVGFYKIDIDVLTQELATEFAISALPTFLSIKNQKTIRTSVGANLPALKELIKAAQAAA